MKGFVNELHTKEMRYVTIIDAGIKVDARYASFTALQKAGCYVRDDRGRDPYVGQVWPGAVYYPDFLHPAAAQYWEAEFAGFLSKVPVDGIWLDMNEVSNFCEGMASSVPRDCDERAQTRCCLRPRPDRSALGNPKYRINNVGAEKPLGTMTISASATHHGGVPELHAHNLFGFTESRATHRALAKLTKGKRPFIIARSTFPGSGKVAGHWTGDNKSTWDDLRWSIPSVLNSNLFGIPFVGADTCGFNSNTDAELCARWTTLSALAYTFSRNHADIMSRHQEPYLWPDVANAARKSLAMRYALTPYLYTLLYKAHAEGGTALRPLFFEFPGDKATLELDEQLMVGPALLVSPVLRPGARTVAAHFPAGRWVSLFTGAAVASKGEAVTLPTQLDEIQVHVREGQVVPMQEPKLTIAATARTPYTLLVTHAGRAALGPGRAASAARGRLFVDDGEHEVTDAASTLVAFASSCTGAGGKLEARVERAGGPPGTYAAVRVFGIPEPASVAVGGAAVAAESWTYDAGQELLAVTGLALEVARPFELEWVTK